MNTRYWQVLATIGMVLVLMSAVVSTADAAGPGTVEVLATAYTCDAHPRNPMYPCGPLRWGGDVWDPGMACPPEWRDTLWRVPGFGVLRCDDTPRDSYLYGLPHIDIRLPTYREAILFGMQRLTIQSADTQPLPSHEEAVAWVHSHAPHGDPNTALARLFWGARAQREFAQVIGDWALPPDAPVWVVTIWIPPQFLPEKAKAAPDPSAPIAAQLYVVDATTGELYGSTFVSFDVVEKMGWVAEDHIDISTIE